MIDPIEDDSVLETPPLLDEQIGFQNIAVWKFAATTILEGLKMNRRVTFHLALVLTLGLVFSVFAFPLVRARGGTEPVPPSSIRITPPAPIFADEKRLDELAARRRHVADTIGPKASW